jgi:hypothetical protein
LGRDVRICDRLGSKTVIVSIPKPKNAWWLASVDARCFDAGSDTEYNPVLWLEHYRANSAVSLGDDEPAFRSVDGEALTRDFMVHRTIALLELAGIVVLDENGRIIKVRASSWRAGGARSATQAGLAGPLIMALGRWRSIAWGAYVSYPIKDLEEAAQQMWRVSVAAAPEADLRVGVPPPFQDDAINVVALQDQVDLRRTVPHRRAGRAPAHVSTSRQCG